MLQPGNYALVTRDTRYLGRLFPNFDFNVLEDGEMIIVKVLSPGKTRPNPEHQEWLVAVGVDTPWIERRYLLPVEEVKDTIFSLLPEIGTRYRRCIDLARSTGQDELAETLEGLCGSLNRKPMRFSREALDFAIAESVHTVQASQV